MFLNQIHINFNKFLLFRGYRILAIISKTIKIIYNLLDVVRLKRDNTWQSIIDDFGSDLSKDYYTELDTKKFIEHSDEFTCGFYSTELNFYIENLPEDEEIISNILFLLIN